MFRPIYNNFKKLFHKKFFTPNNKMQKSMIPALFLANS